MFNTAFGSTAHKSPRPSNYTPLTTPEAIAAEIEELYSETLERLDAVIHHPRSLARPQATWRPPTKLLPRIGSGPQLSIAVTRRRVGPRAQARIRGYGETQVPAYVIELRITDASGLPADRRYTEAWVRALIDDTDISAVHELPSARAATYVWLVDGSYTPIPSPSSLFEGMVAA
ncbi:hypothetical protein M5J20_04105 [Corynebacterium sp. TA-R-1]|uniref:Uncharacterized protein n=1 Tax=Corynebacterium stercoris TaxID=2943490 RepID=A0ABT1G083_9CORY|nr:hypothetical protein [Corynebacterium stercoris]MCP1387371.1 hypothetical protein [Corynebacterium stercoris]